MKCYPAVVLLPGYPSPPSLAVWIEMQTAPSPSRLIESPPSLAVSYTHLDVYKRQPLDNVNALLSFVYTLLTNMTTSALETVGLDPYVGFMHTDRPGRVSLSLDLIEELRPVMADRFVLSLINRKMITGNDFTTKEAGAILIKDQARKKLLTEWQNKKKEVITHPFLEDKVEWGMVPYVQAVSYTHRCQGRKKLIATSGEAK